MKKIAKGLVILIFLAILGGGAFLFILFSNPTVQDVVARRITERIVANDRNADLGQNGLDVIFCGTASPAGGSERAQQCIAIFAGDKFFIVDTGSRSAARASDLGLPLGRLDGVLLTHFHSDHIADLGEFHLASWVRGRHHKLDVYGGQDVEKVTAGFELAYTPDFKYRADHHGDQIVPRKHAGFETHSVEVPERGATVIYDEDGLKISAFAVPHPPIRPAYGYRFDYKGRSVVISGDTNKSDNLVRASQNVDVLIHEVLQRGMVTMLSEVLTESNQPDLGQIIKDTLDYHTSPTEAAEIANQANADMLVFTHYVPVPRNALMKRMFMRGVKDIRPQGAVMADDGTHIHLPANAGAVRVQMR